MNSASIRKFLIDPTRYLCGIYYIAPGTACRAREKNRQALPYWKNPDCCVF